jgi:hypothetical protein
MTEEEWKSDQPGTSHVAVLLVSHAGGGEGPGSGVVTHSGDGNQGWVDHGGSEVEFDGEVSSQKCPLHLILI